MDRPGGYEPSNARSTRAGDAVAVADLAMQRTVTPPYVGSVFTPLRSAHRQSPSTVYQIYKVAIHII